MNQFPIGCLLFNAAFNTISVTVYRGSQFYWRSTLELREKIMRPAKLYYAIFL